MNRLYFQSQVKVHNCPVRRTDLVGSGREARLLARALAAVVGRGVRAARVVSGRAELYVRRRLGTRLRRRVRVKFEAEVSDLERNGRELPVPVSTFKL